MSKCFFTILLLTIVVIALKAQYISNPSFEGHFPSESTVPYGWLTCNSRCTPDIQPGAFGVKMKPTNGASFLGLIMLDHRDGDGPKNEDVIAKLKMPLYRDSLYALSIDLAFAPHVWSDTNYPQKLRISGGNYECTIDEILTLTDYVTDTVWSNYKFIITPTLDSINYLKFEIWDDTLRNGYMLLDNINLNSIDFMSIDDVCRGQQHVRYNLPQLPCAEEISWNYTGTGITLIDSSSFLLINFSETSTSGYLSITINACDRAIGPVSIPVTVDSLPSQAGDIIGGNTGCADRSNIFFVEPIENTENYTWEYSGPGAMLSGSSDSVTIYFSENESSGYLTVSPSNSCGTGEPSTPLFLEINLCDLNIPNSFSPNGDGINDVLIIRNLYDDTQLVVFDRFGRAVYNSTFYQNNWDGNDNKGNELPTDTYWYILTSRFIPLPIKGFIYLKR